jgi:hypothetical protein
MHGPKQQNRRMATETFSPSVTSSVTENGPKQQNRRMATETHLALTRRQHNQKDRQSKTTESPHGD